ncbi:MAG TPA: hypothetical protein VGB18_07625, partial [Candidatus Thermoplasmatota archaeon]
MSKGGVGALPPGDEITIGDQRYLVSTEAVAHLHGRTVTVGTTGLENGLPILLPVGVPDTNQARRFATNDILFQSDAPPTAKELGLLSVSPFPGVPGLYVGHAASPLLAIDAAQVANEHPDILNVGLDVAHTRVPKALIPN